VPAAAQYLLDWFWELNIGRGVSQAGYLGLSAVEIVGWATLHRSGERITTKTMPNRKSSSTRANAAQSGTRHSRSQSLKAPAASCR
jgi:hypothetical protein